MVQWQDFNGEVLGKRETEISVKPGEARRCLNATAQVEMSLRTQFLQAAFAGHEATCLLIGERYLHLPQAHLTVNLINGRLEIATDGDRSRSGGGGCDVRQKELPATRIEGGGASSSLARRRC